MTDQFELADDFDATLAMMPAEVAARVAATQERLIGPVPETVVHTESVGHVGTVSGDNNRFAGRDYREITNRWVFAGDGSNIARRSELAWPNIRERARSAERPSGIDASAAKTLADEQIFVLAANPGEGRDTALMCLLDELSKLIGNLPRVVRQYTDDPEADKQSSLDAYMQDWGAGTIVLLDLVNDTKARRDTVFNQVDVAKRLLAETDGFLVITIPRSDEPAWHALYPAWVVPLDRPTDVAPIFRRALDRRLNKSLIDSLMAHPWFADQLRQAWPPLARRLAELAEKSHQGGADSVDAISRDVQAALDDWSHLLRQDLDQRRDAWYRSLTVATGVLEEADPATIVKAARDLIDATGFSDLEDPHPLLARSVVARVEELKNVSVDPRSVSFRQPEFGRVVLPNVWSDFPELQPAFEKWLIRLPRRQQLDASALRQLARRTEELGVRHGSQLLVRVAEGWSVDGPNAEDRLSLTVELLTTTALHPTVGREIRGHLYNWAYRDSTSDRLRLAVAVVCGNYGDLYPRNALTRLKHLSKRPDGFPSNAVTSSVLQIATAVGPYRVLGYLTDWLTQPQPQQVETLITVISGVLRDEQFRERLGADISNPWYSAPNGPAAGFWRRVYETIPFPGLGELVAGWLDAASSRAAEQGDRLVEVLLLAAGSNIRHVGRLGYAACPQPTPLPPGASRLDQLVALVQTRLDELVSAPVDHGEEQP
jgi:hypothetical protein